MAEGQNPQDDPKPKPSEWFVIYNKKYPSKALDIDTVRERAERLEQVAADALERAIAVSLRPKVSPFKDELLSYSVSVTRGADGCLIRAPELTAAPVLVEGRHRLDQADALCIVLQLCIDKDAPVGASVGRAQIGYDLQPLQHRTSLVVRLHEARLDLGMGVPEFYHALKVSEESFAKMMNLDDTTVALEQIRSCLETARRLLNPDAPDYTGAVGTGR